MMQLLSLQSSKKPEPIVSYLTWLCESVIDIEQEHRVLDWALAEWGVNRSCGGHLGVCADVGTVM